MKALKFNLIFFLVIILGTSVSEILSAILTIVVGFNRTEAQVFSYIFYVIWFFLLYIIGFKLRNMYCLANKFNIVILFCFSFFYGYIISNNIDNKVHKICEILLPVFTFAVFMLGNTSFIKHLVNKILKIVRIKWKTETGKVTTYTYDGSNRLTGEKIAKSGKNTNMAYTYDAAGNRQSLTVSGTENYVTTYNYDANNRLIKSSKKNSGAAYSDVMYYSYDNNGNQTRIDKSRDKGTGKMELGIYSVDENSGYGYEFFTYDGLNQLIKYGDEKGNTASYEYLSNGLRLSKTVNGKKTSFIWDGNNIQFTVSSDETVSYSRAPGYMRGCTTKDMADSVAAKNRESTLYLYNGHGDVTGTTNKDGNIKKIYEYDAFGNEISPDSSDTNPFRYCGEYYDSETESIYLRARCYNMSTERMIEEVYQKLRTRKMVWNMRNTIQ